MRPRRNLFESLLAAHVVEGEVRPGETVGWHVDQTLLQDTTGGSVMLALEALGIDRVRTDVSVQYVDHQIVRAGNPTPQDDLYRQNERWLESACRRFGLWFSTPGNGISHVLHAEQFAAPGASLLGADSHTCAAGALGMLAVGAGGLDVALALAGQPCRMRVPRSRNIRLVGALPPWVSARDVGLELLRRFGVDGGVGWVYVYTGPGLAGLDVMDRHVIAGFGAETGATTSVFPADAVVRDFLRRHGRDDDWPDVSGPDDPAFDDETEIDLASVEPLIALPSSPGNVVPVRTVAGAPIAQAYFASAGNPGYAGYAVPAEIVRDRRVAPGVAVDVNPPSERVAAGLDRAGLLDALRRAGAAVHPAGCDEFHRATQAPPPGELSLRTVNRNFPGRSGTKGDRVALVSAETAAASALVGVVTDPRTLDRDPPQLPEPADTRQDPDGFVAPLPVDRARKVVLVKGPNIVSLPEGRPLRDDLRAPVILSVGDGVSTDEILPAGPQQQAYRTNVPVLARAAFTGVDRGYVTRARAEVGGHVIVAGANYGQGSSREHAALVPRYLGVVAVLAESFARIHRDNLVNHGVLPLTFVDAADRSAIAIGDELSIPEVGRQLTADTVVAVDNVTRGRTYRLRHDLTDRQVAIVLDGGVIRHVRVGLGGPCKTSTGQYGSRSPGGYEDCTSIS